MLAFKITPQGPVSQTGPSEVRPEGPFISRFRNILTHINFQSQLKTGRRTQEKRQRKRACAPPRTHPSALSQSQPDLVSQASTMGNRLLGSFMPHSYKRPLEYPNLSVYYKVPFPCRPPRPSFLGVIQASCQILSNCISLTLTV